MSSPDGGLGGPDHRLGPGLPDRTRLLGADLVDAADIGRLRREIRRAVVALDGPWAVGDIELMASELMANALVHGRSAARVRLSHTATAVVLEVEDDGSDLPVLQGVDAARVGGNGLRIVDLLASAWGFTARPAGGKTVWFQLDAPAG